MTPPTGSKKTEFSVGTRVKTRHSADSELPQEKWPIEAGVVVEEFGGVQEINDASYGRDWGVSRRWAIALDSGLLVFRDDTDLEPE